MGAYIGEGGRAKLWPPLDRRRRRSYSFAVSVRAPRKATWNLDEWRPSVGYLQTVAQSCNPAGARWFD